MMWIEIKKLALAAIATLATAGLAGAQTTVPDWQELYDPFTLLSLHLEVAPEDWDTIVADTTFDIEVPALFWAEDEDAILVSVRRKSATLLGLDKISLKIDINEFHDEDDDGNDICDTDGGFVDPACVNKWHGVKKLSIENGDDVNVFTEGFSWYLHRLAAESALNYTTGLAAWVTVTVNGDSKGIYVNVEQRDKQSLKNHGLWEGGDDTWLYKYSDVDDAEVKEAPEDDEGDVIHSPAFEEFCYRPFKIKRACRPTPADFKARLNDLVNMEGLLTFGAVSTFHNSPDDLFGKSKNYFMIDHSSPELGKREYVQWDLDSTFNNYRTGRSIYDQGRSKSDVYEESLVESPDAPFRSEYEDVMRALLDGPFREADLLSALEDIEAAIGGALDADPNNQLKAGTTAAKQFDTMRSFISKRIDNIRGQLP